MIRPPFGPAWASECSSVKKYNPIRKKGGMSKCRCFGPVCSLVFEKTENTSRMLDQFGHFPGDPVKGLAHRGIAMRVPKTGAGIAAKYHIRIEGNTAQK